MIRGQVLRRPAVIWWDCLRYTELRTTLLTPQAASIASVARPNLIPAINIETNQSIRRTAIGSDRSHSTYSMITPTNRPMAAKSSTEDTLSTGPCPAGLGAKVYNIQLTPTTNTRTGDINSSTAAAPLGLTANFTAQPRRYAAIITMNDIAFVLSISLCSVTMIDSRQQLLIFLLLLFFDPLTLRLYIDLRGSLTLCQSVNLLIRMCNSSKSAFAFLAV